MSSPALAPTSRIKLYQPRTKLEQFEDIIMESQSLEVAAAFAEVAGKSVLVYKRFKGRSCLKGVLELESSQLLFYFNVIRFSLKQSL